MDFSRSSAVISGGAGGLGSATSRRLAALGLGVVIFEPDGSRAQDLASEIGPRAVVIEGDQCSDEDVQRAIGAARKLGTLAVNVNAAGVSMHTPATATLDGVPHDMGTFRAMMDVHLIGPFNMARLCAAAMAANTPDADGQRGVIINTASTGAFDGQARQVAYAAGKAGIVGMSLAMARDLADIGVRVNAIAPGPMWTPRLAQAPQAVLDELTRNVAFPKRFGQGDEYASLVEAILRTPFLNGQTIRLDGAMSTPLTQLSPPKREE